MSDTTATAACSMYDKVAVTGLFIGAAPDLIEAGDTFTTQVSRRVTQAHELGLDVSLFVWCQ